MENHSQGQEIFPSPPLSTSSEGQMTEVQQKLSEFSEIFQKLNMAKEKSENLVKIRDQELAEYKQLCKNLETIKNILEKRLDCQMEETVSLQKKLETSEISLQSLQLEHQKLLQLNQDVTAKHHKLRKFIKDNLLPIKEVPVITSAQFQERFSSLEQSRQVLQNKSQENAKLVSEIMKLLNNIQPKPKKDKLVKICCKSCSKAFPTWKRLLVHRRIVHSVQQSKKFLQDRKPKLILKLVRTKEGSMWHVVPLDTNNSDHNGVDEILTLDEHISEIVFLNQNKRLALSTSGYPILTPNSIHRHKIRTLGISRLECGNCGKRFRAQTALENHSCTAHQVSSEEANSILEPVNDEEASLEAVANPTQISEVSTFEEVQVELSSQNSTQAETPEIFLTNSETTKAAEHVECIIDKTSELDQETSAMSNAINSNKENPSDESCLENELENAAGIAENVMESILSSVCSQNSNPPTVCKTSTQKSFQNAENSVVTTSDLTPKMKRCSVAIVRLPSSEIRPASGKCGQCPTCPKKFASKRALAIHHSMAHGTTLKSVHRHTMSVQSIGEAENEIQQKTPSRFKRKTFVSIDRKVEKHFVTEKLTTDQAVSHAEPDAESVPLGALNTETQDKYRCRVCGNVFPKLNLLKEHGETQHNMPTLSRNSVKKRKLQEKENLPGKVTPNRRSKLAKLVAVPATNSSSKDTETSCVNNAIVTPDVNAEILNNSVEDSIGVNMNVVKKIVAALRPHNQNM